MAKGEETRLAILDEATQVASRIGLSGLTIGRLAQQTQMSKSGLFAHFKSKDVLQVEVLSRARQRFVDTVLAPALAAPRGVPRLRALFEAWLRWDAEILDGGCIFAAASFELDAQPGSARDALVQAERDWLDSLATVAGAAVTEGEFRTDVDCEQFAFELHGLMLAHHHASRLLGDPHATVRTRRAFEFLLERSAA
ncbi:MAG TPA: TetR/AcrR family transcriptional regulator [Nocardioidaceae bacterium]|jgi:AcrR family transcriptional regulator